MNADVFMELRRKIQAAIDAGALDPSRQELVQGTLIQLLSECERKRQAHESAAARLMEQYHRELGQRDGMTAMSSMVQDLISAQILRAQRDAAEQAAYALEQTERLATTTVVAKPKAKAKRK